MPAGDEVAQAHEIGKLKSEVHTLNSLVKTLFEKLDAIIERMQAKPIGIGAIIGVIASLMGIFALLFGTVIYISNNSNAPLATEIKARGIAQNEINAQVVASLAALQNSVATTNSSIQLANKEMTSIKNIAKSNESTLEWIIFQKEFPTQIAVLKEKVEYLERKSHLHHSMSGIVK